MSNPAAQRPAGSHAEAVEAPSASSLAGRIGREIAHLYPGYFALVMATGIISNAALYLGHRELSHFLLAVNLAAFPLLVLALAIRAESGADLVHGGWLIAIVGTESLVLLGAQLAPHFGALAPLTFVTIYALWGIGIVFYGIFITLFSYRLFFLRVEPADITPLFWVVMGAAAIATNAGSTLIMTDPGMPFLLALRPFLDGTTLILWAWSTWWIPLLIIFGIWKYLVRKQPIAYHAMFWSLVFPLGMYTLATYRLSLAADFLPLQWVPRIMIWVALGAWVLTMMGALAAFWRVLRAPAQ